MGRARCSSLCAHLASALLSKVLARLRHEYLQPVQLEAAGVLLKHPEGHEVLDALGGTKPVHGTRAPAPLAEAALTHVVGAGCALVRVADVPQTSPEPAAEPG